MRQASVAEGRAQEAAHVVHCSEFVLSARLTPLGALGPSGTQPGSFQKRPCDCCVGNPGPARVLKVVETERGMRSEDKGCF